MWCCGENNELDSNNLRTGLINLRIKAPFFPVSRRLCMTLWSSRFPPTLLEGRSIPENTSDENAGDGESTTDAARIQQKLYTINTTTANCPRDFPFHTTSIWFGCNFLLSLIFDRIPKYRGWFRLDHLKIKNVHVINLVFIVLQACTINQGVFFVVKRFPTWLMLMFPFRTKVQVVV